MENPDKSRLVDAAAARLEDMRWSPYEYFTLIQHIVLSLCSFGVVILGFDAFFHGAGLNVLVISSVLGFAFPTYLALGVLLRLRHQLVYWEIVHYSHEYEDYLVRIVDCKRSLFHPLFDERSVLHWQTDEGLCGLVVLPKKNVRGLGESVRVAFRPGESEGWWLSQV